uniref:RNA-directed RNA polymerase L n=1 Tax=Guyuan tick virus 1 TaxID=2972286 RepID=A0A9E8AA43_9VIRU|nr:MAG: large protein [Guyuan tick virus 1]
MSSILINRQGLSRTLSTRLAAPNDLDAFARGLVESYLPKNTADYSTYRRYMHDILCLALIEKGVYEEEELQLWKLGLSTNDKRLNQQKPDLYTRELRSIEIGEVLLSYNLEHDKAKKESKYLELFSLIQSQLSVDINYNVIGVDLTDPEWEMALPTLPEIHRQMLCMFIENLRYIHSSTNFSSYRTDTGELFALDKFRFELSAEDLPNSMSRICNTKLTLNDILQRIEGRGSENLDDEEYLALLAKGILSGPISKRPSPHPESSRCEDLQQSWEAYCSTPKTTDKVPRVLQLGSPTEFVETVESFEDFVAALKKTNHSGGYLDMIKTFLQVSNPDENRTISLSLSDEQLLKEQIEGPGRKSMLRRLGLKPERKPPTHISIAPEHETLLEDLIQQVEDTTTALSLREPELPGMQATGSSMYITLQAILTMHTACPFSGVAKFYQRLSQEIVINSMRRRKNRQYVLCQSGFKDVFAIIAPGPQLRTESNTEFIKIISFIRPVYHPLSAPWLPIGDHWESEWLSVDTDRLKHWSRSFDRTLLANVACAERLVEPDLAITKACLSEIKLGNYQLLTLTYLEDKQLTSLTNQTLRYLWMKSLGDKQFSGIFSKFPTRVGSVIQSTMLQRAMRATKTLSSQNLSNFISVGKARQDEQTGAYDETTTGVVGKVPRLITNGGFVPVSYNLNEIYWCMMYNKDRQNPAQDALGILNKILKEELKFEKEMHSRKEARDRANYLFGNTTVEQDLQHIWSKSPESHYYSRRAVQVGLRKQSVHPDNMAPEYTWRTSAKLNAILSKNLSQFATFKASVKTISRHIDVNDLKEIDKVGKRTKAVELVAELVKDEKLTQAFEVAMAFSGDNNKSFDVMIQIFKKGQIGGIREIMILFIKARILFNIVEETCRLLSKSDKREILTKGKDKRLMMRGDYEEVLSRFEKGAPVQMIKNSYDMTSWAQKFIPTIFCSIYTDLFHDFEPLKNLAYFVFLKHTNKQIEYPKKLTEMWCKYPEVKHEEVWLQNAKEKFLETGMPYFHNHSNMCQGIPHYNSTVLALSCQSLRDSLFEECLSQLGQECRIRWKTRVGSDDKGDMIGVDMSYKESYSQYLLFEQCAHAAERLHSMELSVKSASGNVIYELNSAFMANLETLSPTIKFALASCDMISTTSCAIFVNEAYGRVRQLRENGGSSVLCGLSHMVNSDHFYTIFRTGPGMTNDIERILNTDLDKIPYDLGVYPFYDIDLQDIVGPEFHNYTCITSPETPLEVKQLLYTPLSRDEIGEVFPAEEDSELLKKDHFGIRQGLVRQLANMRERLGMNCKEVDEFFVNNPFLIIRGPETVEETVKVIESKLMTKGAAEALRRTSPAIYLGRLAAFETAKAWRLRKPNGVQAVDLTLGTQHELEEEIPATYEEFLTWGLQKAKLMDFPVNTMLNVIFPQKNSFEVIKQFVGQFGLKREAAKKYSQAVRTWVVNSYNYNFSNSLKAILETSFGLSQLSSKEDVNEFRKMLSFNLSSYEGFIQECQEKHVRPMDLFFYMSKIYKASKSTKVQTFAYGPSTSSLHNTLLSIKRFSHLPNHEMVLNTGLTPDEALNENRQDIKMETLKFCCNLLLMDSQNTISGPFNLIDACKIGTVSLRDWCETTIRGLKSISGFDFQTRKVATFVATQVLTPNELKEKLLSWNTLNYTYLKRQKKLVGANGTVTWEGDLKLLVNAGHNTFILNIVNDKHFLTTDRLDETDTLLQTLIELSRILSIDYRMFFSRRKLKQNDIFLSDNSKSLIVAQSKGPEQNCLNLTVSKAFKHLKLQDLDSFKVVTRNDERTGAVFVNLEQKGERTATICHFPGSYYPASSPRNLTVDDRFWFKGIRLSLILQNQDWFYNYRLPSLTEKNCTSFFRNDVNFEVVLSQTTSEKGRIVEYLQVMDEVNEEVFNIHNSTMPMAGTTVSVNNFELVEGMNVNQLFEEEMLKIQAEGAFSFAPVSEMEGLSWADMMDEEEDTKRDSQNFPSPTMDFDNLEGSLANNEDGIRFVRSMGYKRRARKANMQVISQMQLGHLLKERVLNMFFKNGAVTSEERKLLPHYYIWVKNHQDELGEMLSTELSRVLIVELQVTMGATEQELRRTLDTASARLEVPPPRAMNYLYGEQDDLFTMMSQTVQYTHERYEESEGSEF